MAAVRFRFDGQPINEADTPMTLEMEEGDTIEVYQQQTGGCVSDCSGKGGGNFISNGSISSAGDFYV